ncbi:MAG TPA: sugar MFS transporter, partial [Flavobacteriales bacterium]|nr:sugar MFS transporter [Flavobacteriales bacterium]
MRERSYLGPFATVTSLFFMWGFITVLVDSLVPRLREVFELTYFQAGLVQFAFFIAYGLVSIPSGWLLSRIGYKQGMLIGLTAMGLGCLLFWPAAGLRLFPLFLLGYFILAAGMTVLQVAANPYVAVLGEERGASSRLNLAQAFNSVGTTIAPIIGAQFILSDKILSGDAIKLLGADEREAYYAAEASAVQGPFIMLAGALLLLALIVALARLPKILDTQHVGSYSQALSHPHLLLGAIGIFLYVGAEVAIGTYLVNYFLSMDLAEAIRANPFTNWIATTLHGKPLDTVDPKGVVAAFVALYWGGAMVGRFVGSALTLILRPPVVLAVFGTAAISLIVVSMNTDGFTAMWSILAVGLFNSVMFPTIFTEAIE